MKKLLMLLLAIGTAAAIGAGTASAGDFTLKYAVSNSAGLSALDPAKASSQIQWQALYMTCANLFNHPDVDLQNGGRVVPEVADPNYTVSADGLTYTFTLRPGFTFSSGSPVTADNYATEINRVRDASISQNGSAYAADITTAVALDPSTLKITLSAPHADLPDRLAMPYFCPVPVGTGATPTLPLPASGPYMVGTTTGGSALTLVRNPNYTSTRPRNPATIEFISVATASDAYAGVDSGTYDVADS